MTKIIKCVSCGNEIVGGFYNTSSGVFCCKCWEAIPDERNSGVTTKNKREKGCTITAKTGDHEVTFNAFQSPRGLRHEDKRPDIVIIDCYQELNQVELFRFIEYLRTVAYSMEIK